MFRFEADPEARSWALLDRYCEDPECQAAESHVTLVSDQDPPVRLCFEVNLKEGKVSWQDEPGEPAKAIVMEFCKDPRVGRLLVRRQQYVRAMGLLDGGVGGKYMAGRTYAFEDFSPSRESYMLGFEVGEARWSAQDCYCVNPDCPCEEAVVGFFRIRAERKVQQEEFAARLDLVGGGASRVDHGPLSQEQTRAVESFQRELVDWTHELKRRGTLLRKIAGRHLEYAGVQQDQEAEAPAAAVGPKKVGRNARCPCGSGRKFKKCCGR